MPTDLLLFFGGLMLGLLAAGVTGFVYVNHLLDQIVRLEHSKDNYIAMYEDRSAAILKILKVAKGELQ